jgi:short-subunit dehydrogenase
VLVARRKAALGEIAAQVATETRTSSSISARPTRPRRCEATADLEVGLLVYNAGADPYMSRFLDQRRTCGRRLLAQTAPPC